MTMQNFAKISFQVFVALTLMLPVLGSTAEAKPYINDLQDSRLQSPSPTGYGPGGPFGTWQKLKETQTFYLHGNCDMGAEAPNTPDAQDCATQYQDTQVGTYGPNPDTPDQDVGNIGPVPPTPHMLWYDSQLPPIDGGTSDGLVIGQRGTHIAAFPGAAGFSNPRLTPPSPPGNPTAAGCMSLIPTVLDDTALFSLKVDFYAINSHGEDNYLRVEFFDLDGGCTINDAVRETVGNDPIATIIAKKETLGGVVGGVGQVLNSGASRYSSDWIEICGGPGANTNPNTPNCSRLLGYNLKAGHGLGIVIHADSDECTQVIILNPTCRLDMGNLVLAFDHRTAFPSKFQVVSDSTRINQWAEDRFGKVTSTFPSGLVNGIPTNPQDRVVRWKAVQANTWGHNCMDGGVAPLILMSNACGVQTVRDKPVIVDGIEEHATVLRLRDLTPEHQGTGYCGAAGAYCYGGLLRMDETLGLQGSDPGQDDLKIRCCNDHNKPIQAAPANGNAHCPGPKTVASFPLPVFGPVNAVTPPVWWTFSNVGAIGTDGCMGLQKYSYNLAYSPNLKDGIYRLEFQDEMHGWNAGEGSNLIINIGGSGFEFRFHDDEPSVTPDLKTADHLVALKEPTKYSMVVSNMGTTTDVIHFAVPTPGEGWTATVSPTLLTLLPRSSANVDVIVTPPANVQAGKIKVVSVTATSPNSNSVETLFTRTTYTAEVRHSVFLTSPGDLSEMRPGLSRVLGVVVHNNGTVRDNYILTTEGLPAGWTVTMSPTFLDIMAATREGVSITVLADASAPPGFSFALKVKACLVTDNTVCGSIDLPFQVYLLHDIAVQTLPPLAPCPGPVVGQVQVPLCSRIAMRDAEWDYTVLSQNPGCVGADPGLVSHDCYIVTNKDTHFDDSAVFRILFENKGDATDQIEIASSWDAPVFYKTDAAFAVTDANNCDNTSSNQGGDGVPDGWRFRVLGGTAANNPFALTFPHVASAIADPGMTKPQFAGPNLVFNQADAVAKGWQNTHQPQYGTGQRMSGSGLGFSGEYSVATLTLPPHTAQYVYYELFWKQPLNGTSGTFPHGCDENEYVCDELTVVFCLDGATYNSFRELNPSLNAYHRVSYRSLSHEALRGSMVLAATLNPATRNIPVDSSGNDRTNAAQQVLLETGIGQSRSANVPIGHPEPWATFNMVATNIGNEYDNLKIEVNTPNNGWTHTIVSGPIPSLGVGILPSGTTHMQPTQPPVCAPAGEDGTCTPRSLRGTLATNTSTASFCKFTDPPRNQNMLCDEIGVYDAVNFQVRCTPPSFARVGDYNDLAVSVTSARADILNTIVLRKTITLRCTVQGNYDYELEAHNRDLLAYHGQTIAFPFSIHNKGLANDRYSITLDAHVLPGGVTADPQQDPWNPQTSSGAIVAVPAGHWYHGFLSVTVPADVLLTDPALDDEEGAVCDCDHFRVKIQSIDAVSDTNSGIAVRESKFLDFTAIVTEVPQVTLIAEPVTIAGGGSDAVKLKAIACPPDQPLAECDAQGFDVVRMNGYYIDAARNLPNLPRAYNFTCLPGDNDGDLYLDYTEFAAGTLPLNAASKPSFAVPTGEIPHPSYSDKRFCFSRDVFPGPTGIPAPYTPGGGCVGNDICGSREYEVVPVFGSNGEAIQQLEVSVPPDQLGVSRVAHRIQADAMALNTGGNVIDRSITYTDAIINMRTVYGVELVEADGLPKRIVPPGVNPLDAGLSGIVFNVSVRNTGLTPQSVLLSNSALPPGWSIFYDTQAIQTRPPGYALPDGAAGCVDGALDDAGVPQKCALIDPQGFQIVRIGIVAPANAEPGRNATVSIFGTVQEDTTKVARLDLTAEVGRYGMTMRMSPETYWVQPEEAARFVLTVTNTGTVRDNIDLRGALPFALGGATYNCGPNMGASFETCWASIGPGQECNPDPLLRNVQVPNPEICYIDGLEPGESRQVVLEVKAPPAIAPTGAGPGYGLDVTARSEGSQLVAATAVARGAVKVLDFVAFDVDGDGAMEYAVDSCTKTQADGCEPDKTDGYESFRESAVRTGITSRPAPLAQFLEGGRRDVLESEGRLRGEAYFVDADGDQRADHFLDTDGDSFPNSLFLPDRRRVVPTDFLRDVTGDQLPEIFVDLDGDALWDTVFDMAKGVFYPLLQADINDDGIIDYAVDRNGNGRIDPDETVLLGGPGGTLGATIFNVDMNGDGKMDQAFDFDGDGLPEHFISGACDPLQSQCVGFKITPRDVTGDRRIDWTYDHTGKNGRPTAYYDPNCDPQTARCSGMIDTQAQFLRDLQKYWVIGVLFLVALALFVALLFVTRRR